jgi:protein-L-isoaspartate O-methyltransferase
MKLIVNLFIFTFITKVIINQKCITEKTSNIIKDLKERKILFTTEVEDVLCSVDRSDFSGEKDTSQLKSEAIGYGATLSAPFLQVGPLEKFVEKFKTELINCKSSALRFNLLDVGSGSGIMLVYFAKLLDKFNCKNSVVHGIEHISYLVKKAKLNISKHYKEYLDSTNKNSISIKNNLGDGRKGLEVNSPYHFIHVGAGK